MRRSSYTRLFNRAVSEGSRECAKAAMLHSRTCGLLEETVLLWIVWSGPVNVLGLPCRALEGDRSRRKLCALMRDKLIIAGPCHDEAEVAASVMHLLEAGALTTRQEESGAWIDLCGFTRDPPPIAGFP